jgi:hypothetical protein
MSLPATDFDSPWKEILERYFESFLAFLFPIAHAEIDWSRGYIFLDKELQQVTRDAELGRRIADKLIQVWLPDGLETWVLIHLEIQSQEESDFAERMFVYHYRLFDRYKRRIVSLAVLGDENATWRPEIFGYDLWGCELHFRFPIVKLLDYQTKWVELEASRNPFATVVMAHLSAHETRHDIQRRAQAKWTLTRRLYDLGYNRERIIDLFLFIDWLIQLPRELEDRFLELIQQFEEEQHMTYISSVERIGIRKGLEQGRQEGRQEGLLDGIALALDLKFGDESQPVIAEIRQLGDLAIIQAIYDAIKTAGSLDALRRIYAPQANN